jgi:hypothetical protein
MPYRDKRKQKKAQAEWYQRNKDTIGKRKSQQKSAAKQWVYEYKLKNSICSDCRISYPPHVLDFDHLKDKSFGISRALHVGTTIDKIKEEIKKCEIVCANCHRERTYERQQMAS